MTRNMNFNRKEYQKNWVRARRLFFLKDKVCRNCGTEKNLQLDHINRADKISHRIWSWSKERIISEMNKCQILCKNCHRVKTTKENSIPGIFHGTRRQYYRGCRCADCRRVEQIRMRKYRLELARKRIGQKSSQDGKHP